MNPDGIPVQDITEERWKELRRSGIGASQAAAVCNLSPWAGPLDVYRQIVEGHEIPDSPPMEWGRRLEPVIVKKFDERMGIESLPSAWYRHPKLAYVCATPDRIIPGRAVVDIKTSSAFLASEWGSDGSSEVPMHYSVQLAQQMAVTDLDEAFLAVLIGGRDFRVFHQERNQDTENAILEELSEFWETHIVTKTPPPPDGNESSSQWLKTRFPRHTEKLRDAWDSELELLSDFELAAVELYHAETYMKELENRIKLAIGETEGLKWTTGEGVKNKITWKSSKDREKIDWKSIAGELVTGRNPKQEAQEIRRALLNGGDDAIGLTDEMTAIIERSIEKLCSDVIPEQIVKQHTTSTPGGRRFSVPRSWKKEA